MLVVGNFSIILAKNYFSMFFISISVMSTGENICGVNESIERFRFDFLYHYHYSFQIFKEPDWLIG